MDIIKYENFSKAGTDSLKKYLHLLSKKRESKHISKNKRNINDEDENDSIILQEDIFNKNIKSRYRRKHMKTKYQIQIRKGKENLYQLKVHVLM